MATLGREWPTWFRPSGVVQHSHNVARGLHPFGMRLGPEERRCGDCAHLRENRYARVYYKCALAKNTGGTATDVRLKWRACEKWEAPE